MKTINHLMKAGLSLLFISILFSGCKKESDDSQQNDENLQYNLKITNPIDNYDVALGSKVTLCIEPDENMSYGDFEKHFYIDNQEINLNEIDIFDIDNIYYNNYAFEWNVSGLSPGSHTLKVEMVNGGTVEAREEITINIVNPKWEEIDITALTGGNNYYINDVFLLNDQIGWIAGYNSTGSKFLLKTTDKGTTWQLVNSGLNIDKIAFYNENTGVAIDNVGKVYKTFDGGASYTLVTDPATGASLFNNAMDISFSQTAGEYQVTARDINDNNKVFRVRLNDNVIIQYTDVMPDSSQLLYEMKFDGANGLIYGMEEDATDLQYIQLTTDNGQSWQGIPIPAPTDWLGGNNHFQVEGGAIVGNNIWLTGGDNSDYLSAFSAVSNDGGATWFIKTVENKLAFDTTSLFDVAIAGSGAYAVNFSAKYQPAMYYSNDNGNTWKPLYEVTTPADNQHVNIVAFKDNNFGIATGDGILYRYIGN